MSYKHIIFDLDGTLINPEEGIKESLIYSTKQLGIPFDAEKQMLGFIGPPLHQGFMTVLNLSELEADEAVRLFREKYAESGLYRSRLYDGVSELLNVLLDAGKLLYLATSKYESYARRILEHLKIKSCFEFISGAAYKGDGATKKELISRVLNMVPSKNHTTCVMVGDTHFDIEGANETGIDSLGVLYGYGSQEELQQAGATYIINDLSSLRDQLIK